MKLKTFFVLIALCFCLLSCGNEGILLDGLAPTAPLADMLVVGPVPEDIKEILWGPDVDTLREELKDAINRDAHSGYLDVQINRICLRREQERYYEKYISAGGIAIMGHGYIDDRIFYAARDLALGMTQKRPELRTLLSPSREDRPRGTHLYSPSRKFRVILVERDMSPTSIPEVHRGLGAVNYYGFRAAGQAGPVYAWAYVRNALDPSNPIRLYHFFSHEFAHAIGFAIGMLDPTFDDRLQTAYLTAMENSVFTATRTYSSDEYWALAATEWFDAMVRDPVYHNLFRKTDPLLYDLLAEWFDLIDLREVESRVYE